MPTRQKTKADPQPLSGFPEWLPEQEIVQEHLLQIVRTQYELHGFSPLRTRSVESLDVLLGKGGDTDKEMYGLHRIGSEPRHMATSLGLHYDLTVPFARYVAENRGRLVFPFRRYQIQPAWRGERPQLGRYREFLQADVDLIVEGKLDIRYDADLVELLRNTLERMPIPAVKLMVNNRKLLEGFYRGLSIHDPTTTLRIIDKLHKVGPQVAVELLQGTGLSQEQASACVDLAQIECSDIAELSRVRDFGVKHDLLEVGLEELSTVLSACQPQRGRGSVVAALHVARGFDYYTGTVVEGTFEAHSGLGAVCSGGRYDELASAGTGARLPGVGMSIGITRIMAYCAHLGLLNQLRRTPAQVLVVVHSEGERARSNQVAARLRERGIPCLVADTAAAYGKQMRSAERLGIAYVWFPAAEGGRHEVKDLRNGDQTAADLTTWSPDSDVSSLEL